ncbi:8-amino-7-oxononanoate synthase [Candidatus Omnitrophota bacterium]
MLQEKIDMGYEEKLSALADKHLLRELKYFTAIDATRLMYNDKVILNFSSNDYLGLSKDIRVIDAAKEELKHSGMGTGASRLISGTLSIHKQLEQRLAAFKKKENAMVFPTGYMANVGIITALFDKNDCIIIDKLSHASIIDACKMSEANIRIYPHKNYKRLEEIIAKLPAYEKRCIITDSVFSMDGDCVDLKELIRIKRKYDALLMIDEAHATGVFGTYGRGLAEEQGVEDDIDISMGTLSKALGGLGGFVVGSRSFIHYLHNKARSFIYTTALPGPVCAAIIKSIDIVEEDISLRQALWNNVEIVKNYLQNSLDIKNDFQSPIIPIMVGETEKALALSCRLLERGYYIPAVRYPTVPKNKARLRLSLSAKHNVDDILRMLSVLNEEFKRVQ